MYLKLMVNVFTAVPSTLSTFNLQPASLVSRSLTLNARPEGGGLGSGYARLLGLHYSKKSRKAANVGQAGSAALRSIVCY